MTQHAVDITKLQTRIGNIEKNKQEKPSINLDKLQKQHDNMETRLNAQEDKLEKMLKTHEKKLLEHNNDIRQVKSKYYDNTEHILLNP